MITKQEVQHVAELAKLSLDDKELDHFTDQLSEIMKMVDQLNTVETKGVKDTTQVSDLVNVMRDDTAHLEQSRKTLMSNAPETEDGLIKVPAIMDKGEVDA